MSSKFKRGKKNTKVRVSHGQVQEEELDSNLNTINTRTTEASYPPTIVGTKRAPRGAAVPPPAAVAPASPPPSARHESITISSDELEEFNESCGMYLSNAASAFVHALRRSWAFKLSLVLAIGLVCAAIFAPLNAILRPGVWSGAAVMGGWVSITYYHAWSAVRRREYHTYSRMRDAEIAAALAPAGGEDGDKIYEESSFFDSISSFFS